MNCIHPDLRRYLEEDKAREPEKYIAPPKVTQEQLSERIEEAIRDSQAPKSIQYSKLTKAEKISSKEKEVEYCVIVASSLV